MAKAANLMTNKEVASPNFASVLSTMATTIDPYAEVHVRYRPLFHGMIGGNCSFV